MLIHEAIGDQLTCVFVDHRPSAAGRGGARWLACFAATSTSRSSMSTRRPHSWRRSPASTDPEAKRKTIGKLFIDVFDAEARRIASDGRGPVEFLAQGTLYPDVIESVSFSGGPSATIKSHHNVGGLPERMRTEARRAACANCSRTRSARSAASSACRRRSSAVTPFLAPASLSAAPARSRREKLDILRQADAIYLDEIRKAGLYDKIWQAFAVLLPVRTVGVMGDGRTYDHVCALRAVTSVDGMTADFYPFDMAFLGRAATRIINEVKGVNRVVYDVTSKPPGTIEWE